MEKQLSKSEISCTIYKDTVANPTSSNVEDAKKLYLDNGCQALLAFGGGSSMDCAKAVGARLARPDKPLSKMEGILKIWHRLPLLIAVPTTAGTGSETTLAAVITDADTHHKYAINDFNLIPDYAVLEPSVTYGLPPQLTATTGMDAVATEEFINHIRSMNISMNIPETLNGIRNEDIPKLARYADKEANPLYPVPALWGPDKLEQMYHLVQEVNEHDRSRNSEHPGKAA